MLLQRRHSSRMTTLRTRIPARLSTALLTVQLLGLLALVFHSASHSRGLEGESSAETLQADCFVCLLGGVASLPNGELAVAQGMPELVFEQAVPTSHRTTATARAVRARGPPASV